MTNLGVVESVMVTVPEGVTTEAVTVDTAAALVGLTVGAVYIAARRGGIDEVGLKRGPEGRLVKLVTLGSVRAAWPEQFEGGAGEGEEVTE